MRCSAEVLLQSVSGDSGSGDAVLVTALSVAV